MRRSHDDSFDLLCALSQRRAQPLVLRTYFASASQDLHVARRALLSGLTVDDYRGCAVQLGMAAYLNGRPLPRFVRHEGAEADEEPDLVLRRIYLPKGCDNYIRTTLLQLRCTRSALLRFFFAAGVPMLAARSRVPSQLASTRREAP